MKFKIATQQDLKIIVDIYNSTIPSRMVTADTEPVSVESRQKWFEEHNPEKRPLWIVENPENQIIGWLGLQSFYGRPAYDATAEISIYLDARFRGQGFGKKILGFCIENAPNYGIKTLIGYIFMHNEPCLKLFRHMGFEDWASLPDIAVLDGIERGVKILGKRVSP